MISYFVHIPFISSQTPYPIISPLSLSILCLCHPSSSYFKSLPLHIWTVTIASHLICFYPHFPSTLAKISSGFVLILLQTGQNPSAVSQYPQEKVQTVQDEFQDSGNLSSGNLCNLTTLYLVSVKLTHHHSLKSPAQACHCSHSGTPSESISSSIPVTL